MAEKKKAAERKEHTVKVDNHIHKGEAVKKGDKIDLTAKQAERLQNQGII